MECSRACASGVDADADACLSAEVQLLRQRMSHPMVRWEEPDTGRHKDWPKAP